MILLLTVRYKTECTNEKIAFYRKANFYLYLGYVHEKLIQNNLLLIF